MINRPEYLDLLINFRDKDLIKVVKGIRRCGKSTLFELFQNYLLLDLMLIFYKENLQHYFQEGM